MKGGEARDGTSKGTIPRSILSNQPAEGAEGSPGQQAKGGDGEGQGQWTAWRWPASQPG